METKIKIKEKIEDDIPTKIRLNKAFVNYNKIIEKKLPYKYSYLDEWILKKSKLLLQETNLLDKSKSKNKYRVYNRGTIIKADFGVSLGSEMSQVHFAIVLNNYDNPKNNILTVIPLTSKASKFNLDLQDLIISKLTSKIKNELLKLGIIEELSKNTFNNYKKEAKVKKLYTLLSYYKSNFKNTYACCSLITTISKTRVFPPINEYDIVGREKCSDEIMNKIDREIIDKFTKKI